ncbi:MAG: hypothetical protein FWF91_00235 [Coriobacteriia bacterium]|nr:hypothetical protein [Coriobacteriia bacterium]
MLGKLLKYEFKATARIFLLMYAALLVVAALNAVVVPFNGRTFIAFLDALPFLQDIITSLSILLYVLLIVAVFVMTVVVILIRFYRMLGNEGYLWFTLPVTANQHIISKLIAALVWSVASCVVVLLSVLLLTLPAGWISELWRIPWAWQEVVGFGFNPGLWLFCLVAILLLSGLSSLLMCYSAMAIGPNLTKSRLGGTVLAFIIVYFAVQILSTIQLLLIAGPLTMEAQSIAAISSSMYVTDLITALSQIAGAVDSMVLMTTSTFCVGYLVTAVVFYILTRHFMTNKLNLS